MLLFVGKTDLIVDVDVGLSFPRPAETAGEKYCNYIRIRVHDVTSWTAVTTAAASP